MNRIAVAVPLVIFLALSAVFTYALLLGGERALPSAMIGRQVPDFTLPGLHEGDPPLRSGDLAKGEPVLVNFFASWCAPCQVENPLLMQLAAEGKVRMIGIAYKDKPQDTTVFLDNLGNPFSQIARDETGRAAIEWGVYGVPETYVVDGQGRIIAKHVGPLDAGALAKDILPAIEAAR
ncbi:MAG: DsbE family thiol:disulfide interchange protein [Alphaproteobacteria bacterium]|nr:DsbE family thiol:disulfide interchange protein [Alphaproteobacteria bacterium]